MVSKSFVAKSMLLLRIFALATSVITVALVSSDHVKFYDDDVDQEIKLTFQNVITFRYVIAIAVISVAYGAVQLPFAVYYAVQQKRLIPSGCFLDFDFYGDKVISLLLGTGIGAGIAVSSQQKKGLRITSLQGVKENEFYDRVIIASSVLTIAFFSVAVASVISSFNRIQN